ncbi:hypothetical protein MCC01964_08140 [Bifidobacteriaceae bacterium MCC01964]|nr:hypothetical protein EH245_09365 [Bifidobacterium breve]GDZ38188.1 hypothetical protein MCC01964_08140 [Bifidobacteriaceae bacterium MCC01964]
MVKPQIKNSEVTSTMAMVALEPVVFLDVIIDSLVIRVSPILPSEKWTTLGHVGKRMTQGASDTGGIRGYGVRMEQ